MSAALLICFAGFGFSQAASITDAESQTGFGGENEIIGTVFLPSGRSLENRMRIRISSDAKGDRTFTTNENGNFAFRGLPTGSYTISIDREKDYEPFFTVVDVRQFQGSPKQTYTLNIRLVAKRGSTPPPAVVDASGISVAARTYYAAAIEHGKKGEHQAAVDKLNLAIKDTPKFMLAYNELGVNYLRLSKLEEANDAFTQALKIAPDEFSPLVNKGIANVLMGRHGEAVPVLRKAVAKDNKSAVAQYFLGQSYANLGLFEQAEASLLEALKLGKDDMKEAHRILSIIYTATGDKSKAAASLETYLRLTPNAPDAENLKQVLGQLRSGASASPDKKPGN